MTAFSEIDWNRPDICGIVLGRGISSVEASVFAAHESWMRAEGYFPVELDFSQGISPVVAKLADLLRWEQQFGYQLDPNSRNLDALHDGFDIDLIGNSSVVLYLHHFERAWLENEVWCKGLLSIISQNSLRQLAVGKRFLAVLEIHDSSSPLVGQSYEKLGIPNPFRFRGRSA